VNNRYGCLPNWGPMMAPNTRETQALWHRRVGLRVRRARVGRAQFFRAERVRENF